jgi:regulator of protease activity HflC (stomatin/prohibitin superfamily)
METSVFERQVITQLKTLNKTVYELKEDIAVVKNKFEDYALPEEDKGAIELVLREEREGAIILQGRSI